MKRVITDLADPRMLSPNYTVEKAKKPTNLYLESYKGLQNADAGKRWMWSQRWAENKNFGQNSFKKVSHPIHSSALLSWLLLSSSAEQVCPL